MDLNECSHLQFSCLLCHGPSFSQEMLLPGVPIFHSQPQETLCAIYSVFFFLRHHVQVHYILAHSRAVNAQDFEKWEATSIGGSVCKFKCSLHYVPELWQAAPMGAHGEQAQRIIPLVAFTQVPKEVEFVSEVFIQITLAPSCLHNNMGHDLLTLSWQPLQCGYPILPLPNVGRKQNHNCKVMTDSSQRRSRYLKLTKNFDFLKTKVIKKDISPILQM